MITKIVYEHLRSSWWVIAFMLLCGVLYEQGLKTRHEDLLRLSQHLAQLQQQKEAAIATQIDLQTKINSQSDPAWVELTLMQGLGLTPEGQQKVFFSDE